jgi:triphosphatase
LPSDPVEVELKLRYPSERRAAIEQHPAFRDQQPERRHEVTTYYDTPAFDLLHNKATLRVRRGPKGRVQTLKTQAAGDGLAASRGEWEWPLDTDEPDIARLGETPHRDLARQLDGQLRPVFTTDIQRAVRLIELDGVRIEAAIDEGRIAAGESNEPVSELELELKQGHRLGALYRLALDIHAATPLSIAGKSKAARGYELRTGEPPPLVKAPKLDLPNDITAREAFRDIVGSTLAHLVANTAGAEAGSAEGIHQTRVALRRLRAALVLFKKHLERHAAALFDNELKQLGRIFGEARDWDVFVLETLPKAAPKGVHETSEPGWIALLGEVAEKKRQIAHDAAAAALHGPAFTRVVIAMAAWVEDGVDEPALLGDASMQAPLKQLAPALLSRVARKARKRGRGIAQLSEHELHDLRKALKKLRYDTEYLGGLFKPKRVKAYRKRCEELQSILGTVNDASMTIVLAEGLAREGHPELAPAAGALAQWSERRRDHALHKLKHAWAEFRGATPFWN